MHTCPDCGLVCYCGGDIDDIDTGDEEAEENCTHCAEGTVEDDDDYDYPDDFQIPLNPRLEGETGGGEI